MPKPPRALLLILLCLATAVAGCQGQGWTKTEDEPNDELQRRHVQALEGRLVEIATVKGSKPKELIIRHDELESLLAQSTNQRVRLQGMRTTSGGLALSATIVSPRERTLSLHLKVRTNSSPPGLDIVRLAIDGRSCPKPITGTLERCLNALLADRCPTLIIKDVTVREGDLYLIWSWEPN